MIEDNYKFFDIFVIKKNNFLPIISHEIGHMLGLSHSKHKEDLMYPEVQKVLNFSNNDIRRLNFLMDNKYLLSWRYGW